MRKFYLSFFILSVLQLAIVMSLPSVEESFQEWKVVPDVLKTTGPIELLKVQFPSGVEAMLGNDVTPTQVKDEPTVTWTADPNAFYMLCMTDPDASPLRREWHHWSVANIPGLDVASGDVLAGYIGSGPLQDSGFHRYTLLLYKQPGKLEFSEPRLSSKLGAFRDRFSIAKFAEKYGFGNPIAGNFFRAEYDESVVPLHRSLGLLAK